MQIVTPSAARRPRAYVRVQGPDAADFLQRMVSNDVLTADSVDALLLTAKAKVIAPLLVWRRGENDYLSARSLPPATRSPDLGSGAARRGGSSPSSWTK